VSKEWSRTVPLLARASQSKGRLKAERMLRSIHNSLEGVAPGLDLVSRAGLLLRWVWSGIEQDGESELVHACGIQAPSAQTD